MAGAMARWGEPDRQRLREARLANKHSQPACAEALRALGCTGAGQGAVSRWETARIENPRTETVMILRKYTLDALGEVADASALAKIASEEEEFEGVMSRFTNEPLLGPRQGAFVDAQIERYRTGPPLSKGDRVVRADLMSLLGLRLPN